MGNQQRSPLAETLGNVQRLDGGSLICDSLISQEKSWVTSETEYPLRKSTVKRKQLTHKDIGAIYDLLRDETLSFKDIAQIYGWKSEAVLRKINNGTYSNSPLPASDYPIRPIDSRKGRTKAKV